MRVHPEAIDILNTNFIKIVKKTVNMAEKVQVNPEKLKVLSAVMDKIEKDFGKGAIMKMSDKAVDKVPVIPSWIRHWGSGDIPKDG